MTDKLSLLRGATTITPLTTWTGPSGSAQATIDSLQSRTTTIKDKILSLVCVSRNQVTQKREVSFIPQCVETAIGNLMFHTLIDKYGGICVETKMKALVKSVVADLTPHLARLSVDKIDVVLVNSAAVNAIALPGGKIVICKGIINQMCDFVKGKLSRPGYTAIDAKKEIRAMLALAIGHELAHADIGHGKQAVERTILLQIIIAIIFMISSFLVLTIKSKFTVQIVVNNIYGAQKVLNFFQNSLAGIAMFFYLLAISRTAELEADRICVKRYLFQAGYDYEKAMHLFQMFKQKSGCEHVSSGITKKMLQCLQTHPLPSTRIKLGHTYAQELNSIRLTRLP